MKYCVIGLGQFGYNLALELQREGHEVLALDADEELVEAIKDEVGLAARVDATDRRALERLGLADMDAVIVAVGENFEASLMTVAHLQKLGVPKIMCRVINDVHEHLLDLMHIEDRLRPEMLAARQLAKRLGITRATRHFGLEEGFAIVELPAPPHLLGKSLREADLRARHEVNLITVKRAPRIQPDRGPKPGLLGIPSPEYIFQEGDCLILFGRESAIQKFSTAGR